MAFISATDPTPLYWHEWGERDGPERPGYGSDRNDFADDMATLMGDPWLARYWYTAGELM